MTRSGWRRPFRPYRRRFTASSSATRGWFTPEIRDLLASRGAGLVIAHDARRDLPRERPASGIAYLRLHYGECGQRGNYSAAELERWARRIAAWRAHSTVYAYFNNDWSAFAPRNAITLRGRLSR